MGLSAAERNRRKRERKKREKEEQKKHENKKEEKNESKLEDDSDAVEIEYVADPVVPAAVAGDSAALEVLKRFQELSGSVVSDDDQNAENGKDAADADDELDDDGELLSKRKIREKLRPSVAALKRSVNRPDLVEAHDVTATYPEFLIQLKAVPGTVPVPRHWGRKRKYLQGKRGFEKPPFQLPSFIVNTGITEIRDNVSKEEEDQSARQKNRARVAPKMGAIDVDYNVLHAAFFKFQTKPTGMTKFGDVYYEGKELEVKTNIKPGGVLSDKLREALGMTSETSPPPWLVNMQRYGPPPSFPALKIPGLNAPLPSAECQYGYHPGGWGKPPVDHYGRPLYGGNPFDPPGTEAGYDVGANGLVTSDGKTLQKDDWGGLPTGEYVGLQEEEEEEDSSDEDMEESSSEEEEEEGMAGEEGAESVLPPPPSNLAATAPVNLRKEAGDETPAAPKQLYQVIDQTKADQQGGAVFASEYAYVLPGTTATSAPEGAESVLSKAVPTKDDKKRRKKDDEGEDDIGKGFKF